MNATAGDAFHLVVDLPAGPLDVGDVYVVGVAEIANIEAYPEVVRLGDTDELLFVSVIGVARDAQGRVVRGAKFHWEQLDGDGSLSKDPLDAAEPLDPSGVVGLREVCENARAGESRQATLRGWLGDLETTVDVQWQCLDDHTDGCGCRSDGRPVPIGLALLVLVGLRRGRRRPDHATRTHGRASRSVRS